MDTPKDVPIIINSFTPLSSLGEPKESEGYEIDVSVYDHQCDEV